MIPSRWLRYVLEVASRPGPLQARAERDVQAHQEALGRRRERTLPGRRAARVAHQGRTGATAACRAAVFTRAAGRCEVCGAEVTIRRDHMDHFFGRARSETPETCWALCRSCDADKTENRIPAGIIVVTAPGRQPVKFSRRWWLERFRQHALKHGFGVALAMVDQQLALEPPALEAAGGA